MNWYKISQRVILIRFWWYILRVVSVILYRCTFVPRDGDGLRAGTGTDGRRAGGQREGRREAIPPPSMIYVGTIRVFGMQKFFFEFGVTWFCGLNGVNGLNGQGFDVSCWP